MKLSTLVAFEAMLSALRRNEGHCAVEDCSVPKIIIYLHGCTIRDYLKQTTNNTEETVHTSIYLLLLSLVILFSCKTWHSLRYSLKISRVKIFANFAVYPTHALF